MSHAVESLSRVPTKPRSPRPRYRFKHPETGVDARVWVGDCREILPRLAEIRNQEVDLVFADPPFNWARAY
ncbi:MAG: hypothetical protein D6695_02285, partial [Planctomycetota bacterium]